MLLLDNRCTMDGKPGLRLLLLLAVRVSLADLFVSAAVMLCQTVATKPASSYARPC